MSPEHQSRVQLRSLVRHRQLGGPLGRRVNKGPQSLNDSSTPVNLDLAPWGIDRNTI